MSFDSVAAWVRALAGWRQWLLACATGVGSVLAMAPFHIWPILCVTLPILVWQIDGALMRAPAPAKPWWRTAPAIRAAIPTWWFAFGYFFAGLFWIGEAFLVEASKFAVLLPVAVTILPAGLALFWAGAAAAASLAWRPGLVRVLAFAVALAAGEWLRGHVLTGFPWNVIGYALTYPTSLMQSAGLIGIYGLSIIAVFALAAPLVAWIDGGTMRTRSRGAVLMLVTIAAMMAYGHARLAEPEPAIADAPRIRLVQPSVPQREKWQPQHQRQIFDLHLALTVQNAAGQQDGAAGIDLVLWPEAAMPFLPLETPEAIDLIAKTLPPGTQLVSGALRTHPDDGEKPPQLKRLYNSIIAFDDEARVAATYDKIHLVPFGEYLPLYALLSRTGLEPLAQRRAGFETGPRPRPLMSLPLIPPFVPLICYEAIFPSAIVQGQERPSLLVNMTNDGWFGNTTGPRQHLHQARVRAVEEALPMVRIANNGISAVIDARGRILHRLDLDVVGVIDATVPPALPPTPYARFGDLAFVLMLLCGLVVVSARRVWQDRTAAVSRSGERG